MKMARLAYRWDGDVEGTWFLKQLVGGILRHGFELGGRAFGFIGYSPSPSALHEPSVWFVSPFRESRGRICDLGENPVIPR